MPHLALVLCFFLGSCFAQAFSGPFPRFCAMTGLRPTTLPTRQFDDLSDLQIVEEIQREAQLLLEHHAREMAEKSVEDVGFQGKTGLGSRRR